MSEPTEATVRAEVRAWLEANWNPDLGLVEWRNKLVDSGWGVPHWPTAWHGRDLPVGLVPVVEEEIRRIGAVGVAKAGIRVLAAATILAHGTDLQKEKFLRRSLTGEDTWCQLFSEPGSGSDLAGAMTRAEFKGNRWVVNGQKVWTTSAHHADWGLLLARTDWDKPKHAGAVVFHPRHATAGRRGASAAADERPRLVQPGVLHRRRGAARDAGRRGRPGLGGGDHHPDARAPRRRRPPLLGSGIGPAGTLLRRGARRDQNDDGALQVVSAARRPGRSDRAAGEGDRPLRRSRWCGRRSPKC